MSNKKSSDRQSLLCKEEIAKHRAEIIEDITVFQLLVLIKYS